MLTAILGLLVAVLAWLFRHARKLELKARVMYWRITLFTMKLARKIGDSGRREDATLHLAKVPARTGICLERCSYSISGDAKGLEKFARKCARITLWCMDAGVDEMVIFEGSGELQSAISLVANCLKHLLLDKPAQDELMFGKLNRIRGVSLFQGGSDVPYSIIKCANVEEGTEEVVLRFFSDTEAAEDMARLTQELVDDKDTSLQDIDEDLLDKRLYCTKSAGGRLDLLLVFSDTPNLHGFPAWIARSPEILTYGESLEEASYASFVRTLFRYARTEQRWGR
mmetsp:Transcript_11212/g.21886  ORF Transcript_11212/g.21886 Transcript_11212/m.21886 type:complete len:283 (+) Transcript_11212:2214-3062(+)